MTEAFFNSRHTTCFQRPYHAGVWKKASGHRTNIRCNTQTKSQRPAWVNFSGEYEPFSANWTDSWPGLKRKTKTTFQKCPHSDRRENNHRHMMQRDRTAHSNSRYRNTMWICFLSVCVCLYELVNHWTKIRQVKYDYTIGFFIHYFRLSLSSSLVFGQWIMILCYL